LHKVSKNIVNELKENKQEIAFEKLTFIRRLYQKGNGQGNNYRGKMNAWSFAEIKRQIKYKAEWEGIKVIELSSKILVILRLSVINAGREPNTTNLQD
jgi:putative transposase